MNRPSKSIMQTSIALAAALLFLGDRQSAASQAAEYRFTPTYQVRNLTLTLSGAGVLKYLGFITIYDGALYLPPGVPGDRALEDVPKRLEVEYRRSFKAEDFGPATIAGIRKNVDPQTFAALRDRIAYHNSLYMDMSPGDRVSLTYLPSVGTLLEINGRLRGTIQGADFAEALFSMWLGDRPFDETFKRSLLGGAE